MRRRSDARNARTLNPHLRRPHRFHFGARSVEGPHGQVWQVQRRWTRRPRWTGPIGRWLAEHFDPFAAATGLKDILFGILAFAFIIFMVYVGLPGLLFLLDALYVALLLAAAFVAHTVLGRPWRIEATRWSTAQSGPQETLHWNVHGWKASTRALEEAAAKLSQGRHPKQLPLPTPLRPN